MKKIIKKYSQFINEDTSDKSLTRSDILDLRSEFVDAVREMSYDYGLSYSSLAKRNDSPYEDFNEMQKEMDDMEWTIEAIKEILSDEASELCGESVKDFIERSPLSNISGYVDIYLYLLLDKIGLDKNDVDLGGPGWPLYVYEEGEAIIRYKYGYHKTEYGKLMLDQLGVSVDEFRDLATKDLQEYIDDNWNHDVLYNILRNKNIRSVGAYVDFKDYSISESDRIVIFTEEMAKFLNDRHNSNITSNDIASEFSRFFEDFGLEMDKTDTELIVWGNFQEKN